MALRCFVSGRIRGPSNSRGAIEWKCPCYTYRELWRDSWDRNEKNQPESQIPTSPRVLRSLTSWPGSESGQTKRYLEPGDLWWRPASDLAGESPHLPFFDHSSAQLRGKLWWALAPDARTGLRCWGQKSVPRKKSTKKFRLRVTT